MTPHLQRPVAIVTGGSSGIGLATALRFAQAGFDLAICGRDASALKTAAEAIVRLSVQCLPLTLDLADERAAREVVRATHEHFGRLDVLVNNAARAPNVLVEQMSAEDYRLTMALNVDAIFHTTQAAWPILKKQGGGVIVNLSSLASVDPFPGFAVYGASKAWVNLFTRACAEEGRTDHIRVYCVAPGAVETPMLRGLFPEFPAEKCLRPDDVAEVICRLCDASMGPAAGQTIFVKR